ncbi:SDR family oxidoreductase [Paenibacillus antarcticus]|uniref:Short-chain dehydrogenase n=1 Tax=Paenibacillus antarcticus TaxID=253703 RepID=A0A168QNL0_9BACL|nr:SDR family oxidoreductase [Paenibacillus antarcticus]OAB47998.1 hypothetical protein PBAT_03735 [Paenibacillus antarcticus]
MKSILLTGCSKGIGKAVLDKLIELEKYRVYALSKNVHSIDLSVPNVHVYPCDLANANETEEVAKKIIEDSGGIDILVNNAGIGLFKKVEDISLKEWSEVLAINLTATFILTKTVMSKMKENNSGKIINITSDADHIGFAEGSLYCASKFAVRGFADSIRDELKGTGISVTTIGPGRVDTYFNGKKPGDRPISLQASQVAAQVVHVISMEDTCGIERIYLKSTLE